MAIITVRIVRHGNTEGPAEPDRERRLSGVGRDQAFALGLQWRGERFIPGIVLSSAAPRAVETAEIACGIEPGNVPAFEELYFGTDSSWIEPITAAFRERGPKAPLKEYLNSGAGDALKAWGAAASALVLRQITDPSMDLKIAIFTHGLFGQTLACSFPMSGSIRLTELSLEALNNPLEECGTIDVNLLT